MSRARSALALVAVLAAAGCPRRPANKAGRETTLTLHAEAEPAHLVNMIQPDGWGHRITSHNLFESLIRIDPRTLAVTGELASTWQLAKDGRTFTFYLRSGVKWHDGKPFGGEDVKLTLDRLMDERVRATSARASLQPFIESYRLKAPAELEIVCKCPSVFFLAGLADLSILPAHLMRSGDLNSHPLLRRPVGTGPYRLVSWEAGRQITLARFADYWGPRPRIDRLVYRFVTNPETALQLARRGELGFIGRLRAAQWEAAKKDPQIQHEFVTVRHYPPGSAHVMLNLRRPIFSDARTRRALAMLLDVETITRKIMHGLARPIGALYWFKDPDHNSTIPPLRFDPAGARRLLAQAGWSDSDGNGVLDKEATPLRFVFYLIAGSRDHKLWLTMYQEELRKAGVVLEISPIEWKAYMERVRRHDFDAGALFMQQVGPHSDLYFQFHSSQIDDGQNYAAYSNPRADKLLAAIRCEMDATRRRAMSLELQKILADDMAVIPLFSLEDPGIVARRVHGVYASALWYQPRDWWIE
jgi:peptide/nickel transport system substrate-binding protein